MAARRYEAYYCRGFGHDSSHTDMSVLPSGLASDPGGQVAGGVGTFTEWEDDPNISKAQHLNGVIQEALRLHPAILLGLSSPHATRGDHH